MSWPAIVILILVLAVGFFFIGFAYMKKRCVHKWTEKTARAVRINRRKGVQQDAYVIVWSCQKCGTRNAEIALPNRTEYADLHWAENFIKESEEEGDKAA